DPPRLHVNDSRASMLRGEKPLAEADDLWLRSRVIIVRSYDCQGYHQSVRSLFEAPSPELERQVDPRLRPYLDKLSKPGPRAVQSSERIVLSDSLFFDIGEQLVGHTLGRWRRNNDLLL